MKEVYRSFEGMLDMDNQNGYVIYELKNFFEIHFLNIESNSDSKVRIRKELLPEEDFGNSKKITSLTIDIENGAADYGQCWWHDKWYGYEAIDKIIRQHDDYCWKRFV